MVLAFLCAALVLVAIGCGGDGEDAAIEPSPPPRQASTSTPTIAPSPAGSTSTLTISPSPTPSRRDSVGAASEVTDHDSLVSHLEGAGFKIEAAGELKEPYFSVIGRALLMDDRLITVFEFPDADAAARETSGFSPDAAAIEIASNGAVSVTSPLWSGSPHFFRSGKLVVLYVGHETQMVEALEAVLGPQFAGGN